jgi:DNA polymerase-3 subunit epsilon
MTTAPKRTKRALQILRPLAFFDLETTGTDVTRDRIVEIAIVKVRLDGREETFQSLVNPEVHIPKEASDVHGINDSRVKNEPMFKALANKLKKFLDGCDFAGFRVMQFDLPLLRAEFERVEIEFTADQSHVVDVHVIYQEKERRDLTTAMKFYCDSDHDGAHSALEDVRATQKVLAAQIARYDDLPCSAEKLSGFCKEARPNRHVDSGRWFETGTLRFCKGKHKGKPLCDVAESDPSYLQWMLDAEMPKDTKQLVRSALQRAGE